MKLAIRLDYFFLLAAPKPNIPIPSNNMDAGSGTSTGSIGSLPVTSLSIIDLIIVKSFTSKIEGKLDFDDLRYLVTQILAMSGINFI